jgi:hypothetical protein
MTPVLTNEELLALTDEDYAAIGLTREEMAALRLPETVTHPVVLFSDLMIRTKDKRVVPFEPNAVQRLYLDQIEPEWRAGKIQLHGLKEIVLKARQFGFSTLILALLYLDTVNNPNTETVVIAHDGESTEKMFRTVHLFHENLPEEKRPITKALNKRELVYPALNSTFRVLTAGTKTSGRSSTINNLHMSEVAFWEFPEVTTGLLQAVTRDGNVFQETTANGEGHSTPGLEGEEVITGSQFHVDYVKAKSGRSTFTARFFAWWQHDEYRLNPPVGFAPLGEDADSAELDRYGNEQELIALYRVDHAQIYWRRCKIDEPGMGNMFRQEYPANDVEAFRTGGLRFFDTWDDRLHVMDPFSIPAHWMRIASYDWGFGAPRCLLLAAVDEWRNVYVTNELYNAGMTNPLQARSVVDLFAANGIPLDTLIWADPSMWALKTQSDGRQVADIEAFYNAGLSMVEAGKNTQHAWSNVRTFLHGTISAPAPVRKNSVVVFRPGPDGQGGCPNLIRTMPLMKRDPMRPEKLLEVFQGKPVEDHAPATFSYLLGWHIYPAPPKEDLPPKRWQPSEMVSEGPRETW